MTILLAMLAGWINRQQQDMIEYLKTANVYADISFEDMQDGVTGLYES